MNSGTHKQVISYLKNKKQKMITKQFEEAEKKQSATYCDKYCVTAIMFRIVYAAVKLNIPLMHHRDMVQLIHSSGGSVGYHHFEHTSALKMGTLISETFHQQLIDYILQSDSPRSIICDAATDPRQNHYLSVLLQGIEDNLPKVYFYRLILLGSDETAEGLLQVLLKAFDEDGITDKMRQNLVGFTSDGASGMLGKHNGLAQKIQRFSDKHLIITHCMGHRLELAIKSGFAEFNFMTHLNFFLNDLYSFYYGHSHKNKALMREFLDRGDDSTITLNYIFGVRWISSEKSAVTRVINSYCDLVKDLHSKSESDRLDSKTREKAKAMAKKLQNKKFFMVLNFHADLVSILSFYSLEFQKRHGILMDQVKNYGNLKFTLEKASNTNGEYIQNLQGNKYRIFLHSKT